MLMYVRRGPSWLLVLLLGLVPASAAAQLIEGLDSYSDAVVGLSTTRWTGPRVPAPVPAPRPALAQHLDSRAWPLRVHASSEARLTRALALAEQSFALMYELGFVTSFGDGAGARDLYLADEPQGERALSDASANFSALDGARAFALVDERLPDAQLQGCIAQALIDAQLLELDPAEPLELRRGVAAYYARLISGEGCMDDARAEPHQSPFRELGSAAAWFERLSARQDENRGVFLFEMWQFARQRTWEGRDLRASPSLFEAIAKALSLSHDEFDLVASELNEAIARVHGPAPRAISFPALPAFPKKRAPGLEVLGSTLLRVDLAEPRPGTRLRAWSRAEAGRYTLTALRLDARGAPLSRLELPPRTRGQLSIELDARTFAVMVVLTRVADVGLPSLEPSEPRAAGLIVDAAP